jgi:homoserine kinase
MNAKTAVRAFAPGSVGNIGPGLDIMGLALTGPGDTVEAGVGTVPGVTVAEAGHPDLPSDPMLNTAALAAAAVAKLAGKSEASIEIRIRKGLPL